MKCLWEAFHEAINGSVKRFESMNLALENNDYEKLLELMNSKMVGKKSAFGQFCLFLLYKEEVVDK